MDNAWDKVKYGLIRLSRINNTKVNWTIWKNLQLFRELMPVLVISKFDEVSFQLKAAVLGLNSIYSKSDINMLYTEYMG